LCHWTICICIIRHSCICNRRNNRHNNCCFYSCIRIRIRRNNCIIRLIRHNSCINHCISIYNCIRISHICIRIYNCICIRRNNWRNNCIIRLIRHNNWRNNCIIRLIRHNNCIIRHIICISTKSKWISCRHFQCELSLNQITNYKSLTLYI